MCISEVSDLTSVNVISMHLDLDSNIHYPSSNNLRFFKSVIYIFCQRRYNLFVL